MTIIGPPKCMIFISPMWQSKTQPKPVNSPLLTIVCPTACLNTGTVNQALWEGDTLLGTPEWLGRQDPLVLISEECVDGPELRWVLLLSVWGGVNISEGFVEGSVSHCSIWVEGWVRDWVGFIPVPETTLELPWAGSMESGPPNSASYSWMVSLCWIRCFSTLALEHFTDFWHLDTRHFHWNRMTWSKLYCIIKSDLWAWHLWVSILFQVRLEIHLMFILHMVVYHSPVVVLLFTNGTFIQAFIPNVLKK